MTNQIPYYKATIEYIFNHHNFYFPPDELFLAKHNPSTFLKAHFDKKELEHNNKVKVEEKD